MIFERHDLLDVDPSAWAKAIDDANIGRFPDDAGDLIRDWVRSGWPVIVRRHAENDDPLAIAVGVPLPPSLGKLRFGICLPATAILQKRPAVRLCEAIASAPSLLRPVLGDLTALGNRVELVPTVFGALLWQHLTGLAYLHRRSDIDLLWQARRGDRLRELLDGLSLLDRSGPVRIDGEILLAGGEGVNWRELHSQYRIDTGIVLVKSKERAELRCAQTLFS